MTEDGRWTLPEEEEEEVNLFTNMRNGTEIRLSMFG
jgi:hypothetical protein